MYYLDFRPNQYPTIAATVAQAHCLVAGSKLLDVMMNSKTPKVPSRPTLWVIEVRMVGNSLENEPGGCMLAVLHSLENYKRVKTMVGFFP
jgi:hypothetical protein